MESRWQHDAGRVADALKAMRRRRPPSDVQRRTIWLQELFAEAQRTAVVLDRLDEAGPDERLFAAVAWGAVLELLLLRALPENANPVSNPDLQPAFAPLGRLVHGAYQICVGEIDARYQTEWIRFCDARVGQFDWARNVDAGLIQPPELGQAIRDLPEPAWPPGRAFSVFFVEAEEEEEPYYRPEEEVEETEENGADEQS